MFQNLAPYYKAVAAFCSLLVPFLTAIAAALSDGVVYGSEWVTIAAAGSALIAGTGAVYHVTNQPLNSTGPTGKSGRAL